MISGENKFVLVTKRSDARGIKRRGRNLLMRGPHVYGGLAQRVGKGKAAKFLKKSRNDEKARTHTSTKKCGCPFQINVKENVDSLWYVTVICRRHNHDTVGRLDTREEEVDDAGGGLKVSSSGRLVHLRLLWSASRKLRMRVGGHRGLQLEAP
ncbi:hypothetical protein Syun_022710 [Stephania yunnanensis]|uniref:FAR1 domain-containing protein n=1 Tax=Stephania yunnanensis TaxID=152371 RepID=A0AAP0F877_9MAGN